MKEKPLSETNKDIVVAFYKRALFKGQVEDAFRLYAIPAYRQHNPLIEDGMEGVKKFVAWIMANHPNARGEIKRIFADGDHVILHSHWHGLSDNPGGGGYLPLGGRQGRRALGRDPADPGDVGKRQYNVLTSGVVADETSQIDATALKQPA
jgi:predicted SnoaL-like aldol condensation-catalyzing enzyme